MSEYTNLTVDEEPDSTVFSKTDLTINGTGKLIINANYKDGIASKDNQSILGKWILEKIFQLKPFEPLTKKRLDEIGLNGIRFYKINGDDSVHIQFIFIDINNPPFDFINKHKE